MYWKAYLTVASTILRLGWVVVRVGLRLRGLAMVSLAQGWSLITSWQRAKIWHGSPSFDCFSLEKENGKLYVWGTAATSFAPAVSYFSIPSMCTMSVPASCARSAFSTGHR